MELRLALCGTVQKHGKEVYFDVRRLKGLLMDAQVEKKYITQVVTFLETGHLKQVIASAPMQIDALKQNMIVNDICKDTGYDIRVITNIISDILASVGIENKCRIEKNCSADIIEMIKIGKDGTQKTGASKNSNLQTKVFTRYDARNLGPHIVIPHGYTNVDLAKGVFVWPEEIISVTMPDSVTDIGERAFMNCASLASVKISNSVTKIRESTFFNCYNLDNIIIPNSVTVIESKAFCNCKKIANIIIPEHVQILESDAFAGCLNLSSIYVDAENSNYSSIGGVLFDKYKRKILCYPAGNQNSSYIIPNYVAQICGEAFSYSRNLENVTMPNSVKSIGKNAFSNCVKLTSITIPNGVTDIGSFAFSWCSNLAKITIPDSVTSIDSSAFHGCEKLRIFCSRNSYAHKHLSMYGFKSRIKLVWH